MTEHEAEIPRGAWLARAAALAGLALWTLWILRGTSLRGGEIGSGFLHLVLLPFHEAGHVAFRPFGDFMMFLGGTIGQHLMPALVGAALLVKRGDRYGAAVFLWLLGFSILDMAVYMYDAFDPRIVLLGGRTGAESDSHDWQNLFGDMGLLRRARGIGTFFGLLGGATMVGALGWAALVLRGQRERIAPAA